MIPKSTMTAVTIDRVVVYKGNAKTGRKLWKKLKKEHADKPRSYITIWNSPGSKVGDTIG